MNQGNNPIPEFDSQGHRGCRGLMPENTIPAMIHALDIGVTTLEMDICFSKDGQVFLSHEPFFNHEITTQPDGSYIKEEEEKKYNMYQMDYDSIIKYDVGLKTHPRFPNQKKIPAVKPLLADLFKTIQTHMRHCSRPYPYFNIETKCLPPTDHIYHPTPDVFVNQLMKVILAYHMEKHVIIQSFDIRSLQYLHLHYPEMKTALLIEEDDKINFAEHISRLGFQPTIYSPAYQLVDETLINNCHSKHMLVIPWTVNSKEEIARLKGMGVDGLISDYPNLFFEK